MLLLWRMLPAAAFLTQSLTGQAPLETRFADEVQSTVAIVASQPTLSAWKTSHPRERTDLPHFQTEKDSYETDFGQEREWCATSVGEAPAGVTRAATFLVPEVVAGALPSLPSESGAAVAGSCRLGEIWYQANGASLVPGLVPRLTTAWGAPTEWKHGQLGLALFVRGSGLWQDVFSWRRGNVSVWVAWTDWDKGDDVGLRTMVWIQRDRPRNTDLFTKGFDTGAAAARLAGLGNALLAEAAQQEACRNLGPTVAMEHLSSWLNSANSLPPDRRAAALLVADSYVSCAQRSGNTEASLAALDVTYEPGCPQDGPGYAHTFRAEAEAIDPTGAGGALAVLAKLQSPCSLKGTGPWPDRVVSEGQKALRQFPPGPWSPWMRLAIAQAHDIKLLYSMPPGEVDTGTIYALTPDQARQERAAAIEGFARFVREQPDSPDAVHAWQEAWRLMAGLPPSPIHFGCGCE